MYFKNVFLPESVSLFLFRLVGFVYVKKLGIVIFSYLDWQKSNTGSVHQVIRVEENNQTIFLSWKLFQVIS